MTGRGQRSGPTRRELALQLLRDAGRRGVHTGDFLAAGVGGRYGARLQELRDLGYVIEAHHVRLGQWLYVLLGEPPCERAAPARAVAADTHGDGASGRLATAEEEALLERNLDLFEGHSPAPTPGPSSDPQGAEQARLFGLP
jgi:hypothetical protein